MFYYFFGKLNKMQASTGVVKSTVKRVKTSSQSPKVSEAVSAPITPPATPEEVVEEHSHISVDDLMSVLANYKKAGNFRLIKKRIYKKKSPEVSPEELM